MPRALWLLAAVPLFAQYRVPPADAARISQEMDAPLAGKKLTCLIDHMKPALDFSFRFFGRYLVRCPIRIFDGEAAGMTTYLRIRPAVGPAVVLQETYSIPAIPPDMLPRVNLRSLNSSFETSGAFALGEGEYAVDLLITDSRGRAQRQSWKVKAVRGREEREVAVAMRPDTAGPLFSRPWSAGPETAPGKGLRVAVLLHAAPINPNSSRLRSWDRAFLLDSVSSLLRQIPRESVRLVAFNLDQQREIFRTDRFDRNAAGGLARALRDLELGTISYNVLKRQNGAVELLAGIANRELEAEDPVDAVIFLGPVTRIFQKVPAELLQPASGKSPRFFYFEYYPVWKQGAEFPDILNSVTLATNGSTMKVHSPGELARGIQRMLALLRTSKEPSSSQ